jgi:hypothetical protein
MKPLSLWVLRRPGQRVHLLGDDDQPLRPRSVSLRGFPSITSASPVRCWPAARSLSRCEIDIHEVPRLEYDKLTDDRLGRPSAAIRRRIEQARETECHPSTDEAKGNTRVLTNADRSAPRSRRLKVAEGVPPECSRVGWRKPSSTGLGARPDRCDTQW